MIPSPELPASARKMGPWVAAGVVCWVLCVPFHAVAQDVFNGPGTSLGSGSTKGGIPVLGLWKRPWRKVHDLDRDNQTSPIPFYTLGAGHQVWDTRSATFGFYHVQNATNGTALEGSSNALIVKSPSRRCSPARQRFSVAEWENRAAGLGSGACATPVFHDKPSPDLQIPPASSFFT